jgi:hypothetical protein
VAGLVAGWSLGRPAARPAHGRTASQPQHSSSATHTDTPSGDPAHETDRKILKSAQQGHQNPLQLYVPAAEMLKCNQQLAAEIERQLRRLVVFPRQRPPSKRHSCAEVPLRRQDVRGVRLGPVVADPPSRHIRAWW